MCFEPEMTDATACTDVCSFDFGQEMITLIYIVKGLWDKFSKVLECELYMIVVNDHQVSGTASN